MATPTLPGLGRATRLVLSPDGVRAAVVVDGPAGLTLYVGTVVRSPDGGVSLAQLTAITPTLSQISDVAWRTSGALLVLSGDPGQGRIVPYTVGVDGFGVAEVPTAGLPGPPTAIAALARPAGAGQRRQQHLAAGRRHLGHPAAGAGAAARRRAVLPALTARPQPGAGRPGSGRPAAG